IIIYNPVVTNCWGDGIYLGHLNYVQNSNVKILNATVDNSRRNGISVTSGEDISIINARLSNSNGKGPYSGLCIEPSNARAVLNNITVRDIVTFNNYGTGLKIAGLELLVNTNDTPNKNINIDIINHIDDGSSQGMFIGRIISPKLKAGIALQGRISIKNPVWVNNGAEMFVKRKHYGRGPEILLTSSTPKLKSRINDVKEDREVIIE